MSALNDEIRQLFIDGVHEVFYTLFADGEDDGVYYYPQIDGMSKNVYGEQDTKKYGAPSLLIARILLNEDGMLGPTVGSKSPEEVYRGSITFYIPYKCFLDRGIEIGVKDYLEFSKGIIQYKDSFFEIYKVSPTAFVEGIFLIYQVVGREISDTSRLVFEEGVIHNEDVSVSVEDNNEDTKNNSDTSGGN